LKAGGFGILLPGAKIGTALTAAGLLDLTSAAMVLYVLMPADLVQNLPHAAGIVLLAGVLLLVSGSLPAEQSRLGVLRDLLPLSFIEVSHLVGSIAGLFLIVVARGLYRKLYRAWVMAMALIALGLLASLLKGLDWEESLSMLATMAVLGLFRPAFYQARCGQRKHRGEHCADGGQVISCCR
jgi:phosphatidylglycerol lysyltransferase